MTQAPSLESKTLATSFAALRWLAVGVLHLTALGMVYLLFVRGQPQISSSLGQWYSELASEFVFTALLLPVFLGCLKVLSMRSYLSVRADGHAAGFFALGILLGLIVATTILLLQLDEPLQKAMASFLNVSISRIVHCFQTALFEEILVRAILFQALLAVAGVRTAVVLTATAFTAAHFAGEFDLSFALIAVGGGLFLTCLAAISRNLWLPIGAHLSWNYAVSTIDSSLLSAALDQAQSATTPTYFSNQYAVGIWLLAATAAWLVMHRNRRKAK